MGKATGGRIRRYAEALVCGRCGRDYRRVRNTAGFELFYSDPFAVEIQVPYGVDFEETRCACGACLTVRLKDGRL